MARACKFLIGLILLVPGALSLITFLDPELPIRVAFNWRSLQEPFGALVRQWFSFGNYLQTANTAEYLGTLLLCFGLTVAGFFACLKSV